MRLPLRLRLDWSTAGEAERSPFGWVFRGQQAGWRASLRGLGIIGTVLDWPLNGGMKVIVCLSAVCLCRLGTAVDDLLRGQPRALTDSPRGKDPG